MSTYRGSVLATQKPSKKSEAAVYRYVEGDGRALQHGTTLEIEIILEVRGWREPGYGFFLQSAECDGREFPLTADERANIELDRTIAHSDDMEDRRSDAIDAAADARRDR